jgi:hypothetical protein
MTNKDLTRRDFLLRASALGVASVGAGSVLAACGGKEQAAGCNDLTGLTDQEIQMRTQLQYVEVSTLPDKLCDNCQLWVVPAAGAACGGCQLIKGPIAPAGHCVSWAARPA